MPSDRFCLECGVRINDFWSLERTRINAPGCNEDDFCVLCLQKTVLGDTMTSPRNPGVSPQLSLSFK